MISQIWILLRFKFYFSDYFHSIFMSMFTQKEKMEILGTIDKVTNSKKKIKDQPMSLLIKAAKGMYIDHKHMRKQTKKEKMIQAIQDAVKEKQYPIVRDDSLTTWCNLAAEKYGLKVKDILALEIKSIVEKNKASFAFPSTSIYVEKN